MGIEQIAHCVIVGVNGQFGRVFARKLTQAGVEIVGMDLQDHPFDQTLCRSYQRAVVGKQMDRAAAEVIARADCVLLCIPEAAINDALAPLCTAMKPDALLVDIASVKSRLAASFHGLRMQVGYLSIHPMFGPMEDFTGRTICVVPIRKSERGEHFAQLLSDWRATVRVLSAPEHDAAAALVQALPHAALVAFGAALASSSLAFDVVWGVATPIQKLMLALIARIAGQPEHDTYWSIQSVNPFAASVREALHSELEEISRAVTTQDGERFAHMLHSIGTYLHPERERLAKLSSDAVAMTRG